MDDAWIFNDNTKLRLLRYPAVSTYVVFEYLGDVGFLPLESVTANIWAEAEKYSAYFRYYVVKL